MQLTHLLAPIDYTGITVDVPDDATVTLTLDPEAGGLGEGDPFSLPGLLSRGADEIIEALVHGVDPTTRVTRTGASTWEVTRPVGSEPVDEPGEVRVMRFSTGPATVLIRRRPVTTAAP